MKIRIVAVLCWCAVAIAAPVTPVWIQAGEKGEALARVIVPAQEACPAIRLDGVTKPMEVRRPVPANFLPLCELRIPAGVKRATVNGRQLKLPHPNPSKIVAFGDTGCRIKAANIQNCKDPAAWPFEQVAAAAVAAKPDLMMHVGDYLYREDACPADKAAFCGGTPHGDNWDTWNADFFTPARKLLASLPLILARGNHEDCGRSWRGWFYYLDMHPWTGVCQQAPAPELVELGSFRVVLFDSSATNDNRTDPVLVQAYAAHLAKVKTEHAWLLDHHPFWGLRVDANSQPSPETETLAQAWDRGAPKGIDMVLSGHTHTFEILGFGGMRPVQLVAGNGGTKLEERVPAKIKGIEVHGFKILEGQTDDVFGYTTLRKTRQGWDVLLRTPVGKKLANCAVHGFDAACKMREDNKPN